MTLQWGEGSSDWKDPHPLSIRVISAENHDGGPPLVSKRVFVKSVARK